MIKLNNLKHLSLVLLASAICISAGAQKKQDSKPRIKSLVVMEEKYDQVIRKPLKESETYYDEEGNVTEEISYKQGKVNKHFRYQYDDKGNKIREEEYDPSGKLIEYSVYRFENGMRVEKIVYEPNDKPKSRKVYQYATFP